MIPNIRHLSQCATTHTLKSDCYVISDAMLTTSPPAKDDRLTLISISALACILQDILHEGLGHGVTAWLSGAHKMTISTVALESDISTRWISANGTLVNLFFAVVFWLLLRKPNRYSPALRYFFALALAANLFTGTGYFFVSGVTNFGDWGRSNRRLPTALALATCNDRNRHGVLLRVRAAGTRQIGNVCGPIHSVPSNCA